MPDHPPEVRRRHTSLTNVSSLGGMFRRRTMPPEISSSTNDTRMQERYPSYNERLTWEDLGRYLERIWPGWKADNANMKKKGDHYVFDAPKALTLEEQKEIAEIRDFKTLRRQPSFSDEES